MGTGFYPQVQTQLTTYILGTGFYHKYKPNYPHAFWARGFTPSTNPTAHDGNTAQEVIVRSHKSEHIHHRQVRILGTGAQIRMTSRKKWNLPWNGADFSQSVSKARNRFDLASGVIVAPKIWEYQIVRFTDPLRCGSNELFYGLKQRLS